MSRIHFTGEIDRLLPGIRELSLPLGFEMAANGMPVEVRSSSQRLRVRAAAGSATIEFPEPHHFFRALGIFLERLEREHSFEVVEEPLFSTVGVMFDVSRNSVLRVESVKQLIRTLAVMGFNALLLYTEDTYSIEGRPYFGYLRGRYTASELEECDRYAGYFGIEVIPCIQTLAHLTSALQWSYARSLRDTEDVLLAGEPATYELIDEMITAASAPLRSRRIHIGMDEAFQLGLGSYLRRDGYRPRFEIMQEHLSKVAEIAKRHGLRPMMWSDMYFRLGSKTEDYYDLEAEIPADVLRGVPEGLQFVYWDYFHHDEESYRQMIRKHRTLGSDPIFAPAMWSSSGCCTHYGKLVATVEPGLMACKREGLSEVIATVWKDNGAENNEFSTLAGLQLVAEHAYALTVENRKLKERFRFCTGGDYDAFLALGHLDETPKTASGNPFGSNPSKYLLWQDLLGGLFDYHAMGLGTHYARVAKELAAYEGSAGGLAHVFRVPRLLAAVLSRKAEIGIRLAAAYREGQSSELRLLAEEELPALRAAVDELRTAHRAVWMELFKPFGWEVLDIRYGGVLARIETAIARVTAYLRGQIASIEELEAERLPYTGYFPERREEEYRGFEEDLPCVKSYRRIISPSAL